MANLPAIGGGRKERKEKMQDRFKFRAWHKERKYMYEVESICPYSDETTKGGEVFLKSIDKISSYFPEEVEIMQCTGLKDCKGSLIYEGDIVRLFGVVDGEDIDNKHIVKYGHFTMLNFEENFESGSTAVLGWYLGGQLLNIPLSLSIETSGLQIEIIGNIYENKELIEVENENIDN